MQSAQKIGVMLIGAGIITSMILPGRQTVPVIGAFRQLITGTFGAVMGTGAKAAA